MKRHLHFDEIVALQGSELTRIGFGLSLAVVKQTVLQPDVAISVLEALARADSKGLVMMSLAAAWMAKHREVVPQDRMGALATCPEAYAQYLAAAWEIGVGQALPLPEAELTTFPTCYEKDDIVFEFNDVDPWLARRGFHFPKVKPALNKVAS